MKKQFRNSLVLLLGASLFAGCQNSGTPSSSAKPESGSSAIPSSQTSSGSADSTHTVAAPLLDSLMNKSGDDEEAYKVWTQILKQTIDSAKGKIEIDSEGELFHYSSDDPSGFIRGNLLEENERHSAMVTGDQTILAASRMDFDEDEPAALLNCYGLFAKVGSNFSVVAKALLNDVNAHFDEGTITDVSEDTYTKDSFGPAFLKENIINCGYLRSVNPLEKASLYSFDLKETAEGYSLTATVKDLEEYQSKAKWTIVSEDEGQTQTVLGLDEITGETFIFEFDHDGNLEEVSNDIFHARIDQPEKTYVSLHNECDLDRFEHSERFNETVGQLMQMIESHKLESGSEFDVPEWDD